MKTKLSESINPLDQGPISEDEWIQEPIVYTDEEYTEGYNGGWVDALNAVLQLLPDNEILLREKILNLYKK